MIKVDGEHLCKNCGTNIKWVYFPKLRYSIGGLYPIDDAPNGFVVAKKININYSDNNITLFSLECPECKVNHIFEHVVK